MTNSIENIILNRLDHLKPKSLLKAIFGVHLLFIIHLPISHIGGSGLYLPFNILTWVFISLIIGIGSYQIFNSRRFYFSKFSMHSWIGFALILLPLAYFNNDHSNFAFSRIFGLGAGILLLLAFQQFQFHKNEIFIFLYMILVCVLIQVLFRLIINFIPNWDFSWILSIFHFGPMAQKNIFATFLATGMVISLVLILIDKKINQETWKRTLIYLTPLIGMTQLISLQSRTGYLSLFLGMGMIILINIRSLKKIKYWFLLALIGLIIGSIDQKDQGVHRSKNAIEYSKNSRMTTYLLTLELIRQNPIFGVGYGGFLGSFRKYYAERKHADPTIQILGNNNMDHPHNELLFWTAEGGILPLIGILIIAGSFLNMVWKTKLKKGWLYFTMLLPIMVHTQLELPFYISTIHWFIFIFLIFMIDERYGYKHELNISNLSLFRGISLIFPLLVSIYMFTTLQSTRLLTKYERSGYKDPHLLSSIINPHALQKKYETLIMKLNLKIAKKTQNKSKLENYIQWAENYVQHSPYLFVYYDLATAYESLGNREKAWDIYRYAKHLYPGAKWRDEN